ncbi:elongation factor 1-gamma [Fusarium heterosporum]|uniref:Elongation factor 1-gamma n=1 Tax=Fusarium heterosporum TaxID=42747 RepID=A0A8H5SYM8_FUSHE|nr:elongation factor 1-gamma [Fusarium heterosporum]
MAFGTLFTRENNCRSTAIRAVAKANDIELNIVEAEKGNPTVEHLKANGLGKIPAFIGEDGFALSEAIAVAIYITSQNEKTTLLGKTKQDYASILKWMSFFNTEVLNSLVGWFAPLKGDVPYNKKSVDDSSKAALKAFSVVEQHLIRNTYLVGERITLADLFAVAIATRGFQYFFDKEWRAENVAVTRWFETVSAQPIFSEVAEKVEFLETVALTNTPPKKPEQPKKEKKEAAPAAAAAPAADAEEAPAAPKAKHPLEALGKPSFPLDEWKRQYSNIKDHDEAMKYFWENLNFEEWSLWKVDYKYNDELTLTFMSNNLIGGFNNRLEGSRKYIFGCAAVYGENNDSVIQGAFIVRGQEHIPAFDVAPDWESYEFNKLDPNNPEDRKFVEDAWGWEKPTTVNGKEYKLADGKVFK